MYFFSLSLSPVLFLAVGGRSPEVGLLQCCERSFWGVGLGGRNGLCILRNILMSVCFEVVLHGGVGLAGLGWSAVCDSGGWVWGFACEGIRRDGVSDL